MTNGQFGTPINFHCCEEFGGWNSSDWDVALTEFRYNRDFRPWWVREIQVLELVITAVWKRSACSNLSWNYVEVC